MSPNTTQNVPQDLVVVAGHAIFQNGRWYGGHPGEDRFYAQHIEDGVAKHAALDSSALIFSGGYTRPNHEAVRSGAVTNSEAHGMVEYAVARGLVSDQQTVLLEPFARDSFENAFFSLLAFYHHYGDWPKSVHLVTWPFKALRYYAIASGLRLGDGRFVFHGSGDINSQATLEIVVAANAAYDADIVWTQKAKSCIVDPLHRGAGFLSKRLSRMPLTYRDNHEYMEAVKDAYDRRIDSATTQETVRELITIVEKASANGGWRDIKWPWVK